MQEEILGETPQEILESVSKAIFDRNPEENLKEFPG